MPLIPQPGGGHREEDAVAAYVERDGETPLRPRVAVHPDDAWFWSTESQAAEQDAEDDLAAGRRTRFENADDFLAHLGMPADGTGGTE